MSEAASGTAERRGHGRTAAIASAIIWLAGFGLAFVIPVGSAFIWVPDALLLAGFLPIMLVARPIWPWFVFGFFNAVIGIVLLVSQFLPDADLPAGMQKVRHHLVEYHVWLVWVAAGVMAAVYGTIRLGRALFRWIIKRRQSRGR